MNAGRDTGRDLGRALGLHPATAMVAVAVDWALFGSNAVGPGLGIVLALILGLPIAVAVTLLQRSLYRDGLGAAVGKGLGVAALVCVPTPVFSAPVILSGLLGGLAVRRESRPPAAESDGPRSRPLG